VRRKTLGGTGEGRVVHSKMLNKEWSDRLKVSSEALRLKKKKEGDCLDVMRGAIYKWGGLRNDGFPGRRKLSFSYSMQRGPGTGGKRHLT